MKRFGMGFSGLLLFAALHSSCFAQVNPWNGDWKVDPSTIKYDLPAFTIATDADGYTITQGSAAGHKVVCDGQPKPDAGRMVTCAKTGDGYTIDATRDGKTVSNVTVSISPDGKTLTRTAKISPPDDSPYTMTSTSDRVSGGPGFSGVWKQTGVNSSSDTGILSIAVSGDNVAFKETDRSKPAECKLDGTQVKLSESASMSIKLEDPHTLKVTYYDDGKVRRQNTFILSQDGSAIQETDVTPEPAPSTTSMSFHKS